MEKAPDTLLKLTAISKQFYGTIALNQVDFDLKRGEIHALCGENGAGKSTLMHILSGNVQPDTGQIILKKKLVKIRDQVDAHSMGIGIVYQERSLVDNLSVGENIYVDNQPTNCCGIINYKVLFSQAKALLHKLGMHDINPRTKLEYLSPGQQQMVEIAKALSQEPCILILDEPTASISESDTQILFNLIQTLANTGVAIVYISHRMAEIFKIANRVSVLKDGKNEGTYNTKDITIGHVIKKMVGRKLNLQKEYSNHSSDESIMQVEHLTGNGFENVSFDLKKGEILGLAGLVGAGRSELVSAIFGVGKTSSGKVIFHKKEISIKHPSQAIEKGIVYLPEHRKTQGLFLNMTIEENIVATNLDVVAKGWCLSNSMLTKVTRKFVEKLDIRTHSTKQPVFSLSGGNQQKVVLAKCLINQPEVLMVDEPTHGVDIGAKTEIYNILKELTSQGTSIIMISSELPELLRLSDRIVVLSNGHASAEFSKNEFSEKEIMYYASGTKKGRPKKARKEFSKNKELTKAKK